jgi:hypothetical protein
MLSVASSDAAAIVAFAALGRASHHESAYGPVLGTLLTATPFLIGWFAAAIALGAYTSTAIRQPRTALLQVTRAWLVGGLIGLGIRSLLERRIVPFSFILIALFVNLAFLLISRSLHLALTMRFRG